MMRKSIVALAAVAVLGTAAIPLTAAAQRGDFRGGMGNRAAFNDRGFNDRGFSNRGFSNRRFSDRGFNNRGFNNRFVARNDFRRRGFRNRFGFRHHFFRPGFAFASCSVVRRSWTPWGWRWRRIWVC